MAINPVYYAWFMCYLLQSDWYLLLLVNVHGCFHCKQGMLLENIILQIPVLQLSVVYETESSTSYQYHRSGNFSCCKMFV